MSGNTFGKHFRLTTFGESHGEAIGGIIDGCPSGLMLDLDAIKREMNRRKPGQSTLVTQRKEDDEVIFLSGIFEGKTTGTPIGFMIKNILQMYTDQVMQIMFTIKSTVFAIIEEEEEARREKQHVEW